MAPSSGRGGAVVHTPRPSHNAGSAREQEAADGDHPRTTTTTTAGAAGAPVRPRARWGDDLAAALLGTWVVGGLFLDGWAHVNQPGLETFFSPWHAVFYLGFVVSTVVLARLVAQHQRGGRFDPALVPAGYGLGMVGVALFVAGGVADGAWHTIFGVETSVAALLSPSHLLLLSGGLLMVTSPVRSAWSSPDLPARSPALALLPALWATALTTTVLLFFFQYLSAFVSRFPSTPAADGPEGLLTTIVGVAAVLVTNLIVVAPVLLLARRWRLPFGTVALLATAGAVGLTSLREFALGALVPAMLAGGLAADLLLARLRPGPDRPGPFRAAGALVPGAAVGRLAGRLRPRLRHRLAARAVGRGPRHGLPHRPRPQCAGPPAGRARRGLEIHFKGISAPNLGNALLWTSRWVRRPTLRAKGGCAHGRQRIPTRSPVDPPTGDSSCGRWGSPAWGRRSPPAAASRAAAARAAARRRPARRRRSASPSRGPSSRVTSRSCSGATSCPATTSGSAPSPRTGARRSGST